MMKKQHIDGEPRKVAVITGATGGMGRHMVEDLVRDHHVYALGRNASQQGWLQELAARGTVTPVDVDLQHELSEGYRLPEVERVDVLVHAAAQAQKFTVADAQPADWRGHMDLNVHAPAELTRQLLPQLRSAEGLVVFINSGAGRYSYGDNVVYAATKHALYALADGLRLGEPSLRVTTIAPGPTDTEMLKGLQDYNPEHVINPVEIARSLRHVVDAGPSVQLTEVQVRPRIELSQRVKKD